MIFTSNIFLNREVNFIARNLLNVNTFQKNLNGTIVCLRGATREEDAQGTPTQSHVSPSMASVRSDIPCVPTLVVYRTAYGSSTLGSCT